MAKIPYHKLNFLVADDFGSFRSTVSRMLMDLGVNHVDMASCSEEIIERCASKWYDVVLCDYNLGAGRTGRHVLEELRFKKYLGTRSIFVLVSAESSRNIVMSAYDCAPDDYLMKPITTKMLHTRLDRLLLLRTIMQPVYTALEKKDHQTAMDLLIDMSLAEDRFSSSAQKMLGELFLKHGEYKKAEKLYRSVLEVRELDWARLGLAKAKHFQGDHDQAGQWLEKIIDDNYLYLPAYDVLADNYLEQGNAEQAQQTVKRSVDVSPMSILRQKNLAKIATDNHDTVTALEAIYKVVKLGRLSCYGSVDDNIILARTLSVALEEGSEIPPGAIKDTFTSLDGLNNAELELPEDKQAQMFFLSSRLHAIKGETDIANTMLMKGESWGVHETTIDTEVDHIRALIVLDSDYKLANLLESLQDYYEEDQDALQKLDEFLDEPASDHNKEVVANVNREGIELYNEGRFDDALRCFDETTQLFPKHIGLQLNIVQALVGKLKADPNDQKSYEECRLALENVAKSIDSTHPQYKRFTQLKQMAKGFYASA